ncbi:carbohydrate binding domain-containing protein [Coraliomargarita algicola]|uniref:Carbohydrate binding domain-containing protein n=1 Tax=Coraliomargarita algicola TaxID=3092156 RepID=A0ABZ0RJ68_9BACT|nr:carbohydrate binding domain-containing protein [Coraliomargarita sp. J2-16]WPJ95577.1 carbohydrate binding domain-containing protein [Coraliomargarita sp. J2-16]
MPTIPAFQLGSALARQDPVFHLSSFPQKNGKDGGISLVAQPYFTVGNKAVYLRRVDARNREDKDEYVSIYIDGKEVGRFFFWGSYPDNSGYPFVEIESDPEELLTDESKEAVTYRRPYISKEGKKAVFEFSLRSLGDSQLELNWEVDSTDVLEEPRGVSPWFTVGGIYRENQILFGEQEIVVPTREELVAGDVVTKVEGDFRFSPGDPAGAYSIRLDGIKGQVTQALTESGRYGWIFRGEYRTAGRVVIDLGEGQLRDEETPPSVAGHDFWALDGLHVPLSPVRNLWPNPSFEQGLRYWNWTGGGAKYDPAHGRRFHLVADGLFGPNALGMRKEQSSSAGLQSLPIPLEAGKTYTLSFYAKSEKPTKLNLAFASAASGGKFRGKYGIVFGDSGTPEATYSLTEEWQRYSRTFVADGAGLTLTISGKENTLIDGVQLESGAIATAFITDPLDGYFVTSDPDNSLVKGEDFGAAFRVVGQPGVIGEVVLSIKNPYREVLYQEVLSVTIPESGVVTQALGVDADTVGEGVFVVRADFSVDGFDTYTDYYRFSILDPLSNTHATKDLFGTMTNSMARIGRGDDLGARFRDWGFGSTSWGVTLDQVDDGILPAMEKRYGISNYFNTTIPRREESAKVLYGYKKWDAVTPELEALIEETAYEKVKRYDPAQYNTWHFGNEEESSSLPGSGRFDEYFKAQSAAARGVKRANPDALFAPTNGTSGYSKLRGYDAMEGYLKASVKHNFKYDVVSVHPYWNIDKGSLSDNDLDEETARLIEQMGRYGYGEETPIFFTELFNVPEVYFPAWGALGWADQYKAGKLSYDFGNREVIQAASAARLWVISLKYWPQLRSTNIWLPKPFVDYHLSPLLISKAANTLGHRFFDVDFYADIKPIAGIRGYSFKRADGQAIAAIWCVDTDVENGLKEGPMIEVNFEQAVHFFDLMGNPRHAEADADGVVRIPLTPMPLLIEAADVSKLTASLLAAQTSDAASALSVAVAPTLEGEVHVELKNLTGREQAGVVTVGGTALPYVLQGEETQSMRVPGGSSSVEFGKKYQWQGQIEVQPQDGHGLQQAWDMDYFYVPKTAGMPDWADVPSIEIDNRRVSQKYEGLLPEGDQVTLFRMAWDDANLYLRVEVQDDVFVVDPKVWQRPTAWNELWLNDGALEVYFDTAADARSNSEKTYDNDDYRYDFSISRTGESGPGEVNRFRAVNHQLAQGLDMPSKEEASESIICDFEITETGYAYTIVFGQRYLEPLMLEAGKIGGMGLYIHDKDNTDSIGCPKGQSLATEPGAHCDYNPQLWPLMILSESSVK